MGRRRVESKRPRQPAAGVLLPGAAAVVLLASACGLAPTLALASAVPAAAHDSASAGAPPPATPPASEPSVVAPPAALRLDPFYKKYVDADGVPILSSDEVPDRALLVARDIVLHMLSKRRDVRERLVRHRVKVAIISAKQVTTDIPEHRDLYRAFPGTDWNTRTRGVGATRARPTTSCSEENLLGYPSDPYRGESILVHEFGHTIHTLALVEIERSFAARLGAAFRSARRRHVWSATYAATNVEEYWAEGVQDWFDANLQTPRPNGVHNRINTRRELERYDPDLYRLLAVVFPDDDWRPQLWLPSGAESPR